VVVLVLRVARALNGSGRGMYGSCGRFRKDTRLGGCVRLGLQT
jgi:hypothetical protein